MNRLTVIVDPRVHRADHDDVIDDSRDVRQEFRYVRAAFSIILKLPRAAENLLTRAADVVVLHLAREVLAVHFRQGRLGVQQVDLAGAALHEKRDHRRRRRRIGGRLWFERVHLRLQRGFDRRRPRRVALQQPRKRHRRKAESAFLQQVTACQPIRLPAGL